MARTNKNAEEKGINVKLQTDASQVQKTLRDLRRDIGTLSNTIRSTFSSLKQDATNVELMTTAEELLAKKQEMLQDQQTLLARAIEITNGQWEYAVKAVKENTAAYGKNSTQVAEAQKNADKYARTKANLILEEVRVRNAINDTNKSLQDISQSYSATARKTLEGANKASSNITILNSKLGDLEKTQQQYERLTKWDSTKLEGYTGKVNVLQQKQTVLTKICSENAEKVKALITAYNQQKEEVENLSKAENTNADVLRNAKDALSTLSAEVRSSQQDQLKYETSLKTTKAELADTSKALDDYKNGNKEAADAQKQAADAAEDAKGKIDAFSVAVGELAARYIEKAIDKLKDLSKAIYDTGVEYEDAMAGLSAIETQSSNSDAMQNLSAYFQDLATNSKYSAAEIANNAQVLANAGYTADEISSSIKNINDLAAGTGEDFSSVSNIVVDGLAQFNMSASDSAKFADTLAKTAISTNTNVLQLGDAFTYVGSVAGSLNYNIHDVGLALGIMASNGIKASQGGTALRSIISRLASNTSDARDVFEKLGGSFYDDYGQARPLKDIILQLHDGLSKLSDEDKMNAEKTIGGVRALSALSAIANTSTEKIKELSDEIDQCNGATAEMASIRMDSVSGDVNRLKNSWKNVASELMGNVEPGFRKVLNSMTRLSQSPVMKKDLTKIAKNLSKALEGLAKWIDKNGESAISAGKNVTTFLATFGGATLASNKIGGLVKNVLNFKTSIDQAKGGAEGFLPSLVELATKNGSLSLAIGGVSLAVGAAAGAIALYAKHCEEAQQAVKEQAEQEYGLTDAMQKTVDYASQVTDSYKTLKERTDQNVQATITEWDGYDKLIKQYDSFLDANGKVKEGYETRADVILTTLANALGTEKGDLETLIGQYGTLSGAIDTLVEKKKTEAVLSQYTDQYAQAMANLATETSEYSKAQVALEDQGKKLYDAQYNLNNITVEYQQAMENTHGDYEAMAQVQQDYGDKIQEAGAAVQAAKDGYDQLKESSDQLSTSIKNDQDIIAGYNDVQTALTNNDIPAMLNGLAGLENGFTHATGNNQRELAKQYQDADSTYTDWYNRLKNHDSSVTQEIVDAAFRASSAAHNEYVKGSKMALADGQAIGDNAAAGAGSSQSISEMQGSADSGTSAYANRLLRPTIDVKSMANKGLSQAAAAGAKTDLSSEGNNAASTFSSTIGSWWNSVYRAAASLGSAAKRGLKDILGIHSPSRVMKQLANYTGVGYVDQLGTYADKAYKASAAIGYATSDGLNETLRKQMQRTAMTASAMHDQMETLFGESLYSESGGIFSHDINTSGATVNQNTSNYSPSIVINVEQREGEDSEAFARRVAAIINADSRKQVAVWK